MNDQGRLPFEVQIKRRGPRPTWKWEWGSVSESDAVRVCGERNRGYPNGEAAHRVVERDTGRIVYTRGWVKPPVYASSIGGDSQTKENDDV